MARETIGLVAGVLLVLGLVAGFTPTSTSGVSCGSAFVESDDAFGADLVDAMTADAAGVTLDTLGEHAEACESRTSLLRIPAVALVSLGAVGLFWWWAKRPQDHQEPDGSRSTVK